MRTPTGPARDRFTTSRARGHLRAVLFDFGGTLMGYDLAAGASTPSTAALTSLGFDPQDPDVRDARRVAGEEVSREYASRVCFLHRDLFRDQLTRTAALLGVDAPAWLLDRFEAENREHIIERMRPRADAAEVLDALGGRGIYRGVVSNADDDFLGPTITRQGLAGLLDDWTSSEEARSCKPDPGIYEHALGKAGVGADEALFVGDSLQHDIAGAAALGIRSVLISNGLAAAPLSHGLEAPATPDFQIETLTELVAIVDALDAPT